MTQIQKIIAMVSRPFLPRNRKYNSPEKGLKGIVVFSFVQMLESYCF
jgi:hypothetical protein